MTFTIEQFSRLRVRMLPNGGLSIAAGPHEK